jgi:hypothetical protein
LAGFISLPDGAKNVCSSMSTLRTRTTSVFGLKKKPESTTRSMLVTVCEPISESAPA